jgi:hypothetical protein
MCCFFTALVFLGPRFAFLVWWILQPARISAAFNTFIWPLLGLIFLPWTTLMYLIVFPGGVTSWDWLWIGLGVVADIASYGSSAYNRKQVPGYTGP